LALHHALHGERLVDEDECPGYFQWRWLGNWFMEDRGDLLLFGGLCMSIKFIYSPPPNRWKDKETKENDVSKGNPFGNTGCRKRNLNIRKKAPLGTILISLALFKRSIKSCMSARSSLIILLI
jgi:hypothetical protein